MTDDEYEDYRNTLDEIVDGGGCMETLTAAAQLRGESPSKRDLLGSDALAAGVADTVDDVLAAVDAEDVRSTLRAEYDDLDDVRAALRSTVDPALFEALSAAGVDVAGLEAFALDPAVCLKTFAEADLHDALTLVPEVHADGVVGRIAARTATDAGPLTVHAVPAWDRSYAVLGEGEAERLVLPDGSTVDCADADERDTGVECDPERATRTEYVQTTVTVEGTDYVVGTVCTTA